MKKLLSVLALLSVFALLAACAPSPVQTGQNGLKIVTTIFPYYDFARAVTGDTQNLTMLLPPGSEAHSFDPAPADIISIENADVFIYTGGEDDVWAQTLLDSIDTSHLTVLRMLDTVPLLEEETVEGMQAEDEGKLVSHEEAAGHDHQNSHAWDEHIWTSPQNAVLMVDAVAAALAQKDPQNAELYIQNATAYTQQIDRLDSRFEAIVSSAARTLMIFGDRFPFLYFTREYGLTYRAAFPGCSTDTNPSAGTIAYLIETVRETGMPYIFDIELSSGSIAKVIAEDTGAEILTLQSCQSISRQNFEADETYVSLMSQNADALEKGLN